MPSPRIPFLLHSVVVNGDGSKVAAASAQLTVPSAVNGTKCRQRCPQLMVEVLVLRTSLTVLTYFKRRYSTFHFADAVTGACPAGRAVACTAAW